MTDIESVLVKCPNCGNTLAASLAGLSLVKHRGREWAGFVVSIRCEECGHVWKPEQSGNQVEVGKLETYGSIQIPDKADS